MFTNARSVLFQKMSLHIQDDISHMQLVSLRAWPVAWLPHQPVSPAHLLPTSEGSSNSSQAAPRTASSPASQSLLTACSSSSCGCSATSGAWAMPCQRTGGAGPAPVPATSHRLLTSALQQQQAQRHRKSSCGQAGPDQLSCCLVCAGSHKECQVHSSLMATAAVSASSSLQAATQPLPKRCHVVMLLCLQAVPQELKIHTVTCSTQDPPPLSSASSLACVPRRMLLGLQAVPQEHQVHSVTG